MGRIFYDTQIVLRRYGANLIHLACLSGEMDRKYRLEALEGLARLRNTDPLTELVRALAELDKQDESSAGVLRDLAPILLQSKPAELAAAACITPAVPGTPW